MKTHIQNNICKNLNNTLHRAHVLHRHSICIYHTQHNYELIARKENDYQAIFLFMNHRIFFCILNSSSDICLRHKLTSDRCFPNKRIIVGDTQIQNSLRPWSHPRPEWKSLITSKIPSTIWRISMKIPKKKTCKRHVRKKGNPEKSLPW